jgi:hypothetical protein
LLFSRVVHIVNKKFIVALTIIAQRAMMGRLAPLLLKNSTLMTLISTLIGVAQRNAVPSSVNRR